MLMTSACATGATGPLSMVLGTATPETKAMAVEEGPEEYGVGQKSKQKSNDPSH